MIERTAGQGSRPRREAPRLGRGPLARQTLFQRLQDYQSQLPMADQPRHIVTQLLPYQRQGLYWMKMREVRARAASGRGARRVRGR